MPRQRKQGFKPSTIMATRKAPLSTPWLGRCTPPDTGSVMVHVDPYRQGDEQHHHVGPHAHDDLPMHSHE